MKECLRPLRRASQPQPPMNVPFVDLQAQYASIRDELIAAVTRVCDSQRFILGQDVESLERELAALLGVKHAIGVSSGTDALLVAMMALGIVPGNEVITSTYTFFATAGSIARLGARPVLVDIDPLTYNLDASAVAAAITPRTKAIVPIHLFGLSADLDPVLDAAKTKDIPVVEDACQAIGARYKDRFVGSIGAIGCFSFFPSKGLGAFGDGGLLATNDEALEHRGRLLRVHGAQQKYSHQMVGGNFRLDALQAAILRVKVPHVATWCEQRRQNAERYRRLFREAGISNGGVVLPVEAPGCYHTYNQYAIRTARRDELRAHLDSCGVGTAIYYPLPLHLQECFRGLGYAAGAFPHAEAAARETLALPMYGELTEDQQAYVVRSIAEFLAGKLSY